MHDQGVRNTPPRGDAEAGEPMAIYGVGSVLRDLLAEIGYTAKGCGCNETAAKMNRLGPVGCRREIDSLSAEIVANAGKQKVEITVEMARFAIEEACRREEATTRQSDGS